MAADIAFVTGIAVIGIIIIGLIGNTLTLFVIIRYDPLRDVTGMFLANLAIADLLQSAFGMPVIAVSAFRQNWMFGETLCTISGLTHSLFCIASVLTLTAVSVDRWMAIVYPLKYRAWLTIGRARIVLVYIWLHALFVAFLPVFGWSRYVYLPYEFICTVQWEYDKVYTIFLSVTCFVTPLIVTVVCYTGVMKVARRHARERPPTTVGRFSESELHLEVPDVSKAAVADGKNEKTRENSGKIGRGKENVAYIADSKNNMNKLQSRDASLSLEESELVEHKYPAVIFDQKRDPGHCGDVPGNPSTTEPGKDKASCMRAAGRKNKRKRGKTSVSPSGTIGMTHLNPVVVLVSSGKRKILTGTGKHPAGASVSPSGRIGKSRVNPAAVVSPEINRWTEELMVIPEEDEKTDLKKDFISQIRSGRWTRVRGWMTERRTEDGRQRRKEMKVAVILLIVNGTFILCWFPHFIGIMCLMFTNGSCPFPDSFFTITTTLAMLNSGCNPFIYTLTYRKFRRAFKRVLPCFRSNHTGSMEN